MINFIVWDYLWENSKKKSKFKPAVFYLKIDIVSHPGRGREIQANYIYIYIYIYIYGGGYIKVTDNFRQTPGK